MKKVLVITYYWPPSGGAGVQRILKFVKYFPKFGIEPIVVTVDEEKASYPVYDETLQKDVPQGTKVYRTNTFEPFDLYSKLLGKKSVPTGFSNESNPGLVQKFSRFARGNFFIPDARQGWIKFAYEESCRIITKEGIDTVLTTSPPHSAQLVGLKLKKKFNLRWIADLRDPWTDIYYYSEFHHLPIAKKRDKNFELSVLENADRIITVSDHLKELFSEKSGNINKEKIIVIPNGYDDQDFKIQGNAPENEFVITYTGTLAESYNPMVFFYSLKKITEKFPETKIKIRFIGNSASSLVEKIKEISLRKNLELVSTVAHDESINYLLTSTILLLVIPENTNDKGILTGKLFEYLGARKPIICIGPPDGDAASIIRECNAGKTFGRSMENDLTDYLEGLIKSWKSGGKLDVKNDSYLKYSRYKQTEKLSEIILSA